jgi:hypothetical protein
MRSDCRWMIDSMIDGGPILSNHILNISLPMLNLFLSNDEIQVNHLRQSLLRIVCWRHRLLKRQILNGVQCQVDSWLLSIVSDTGHWLQIRDDEVDDSQLMAAVFMDKAIAGVWELSYLMCRSLNVSSLKEIADNSACPGNRFWWQNVGR